jgi:hypothetical protein
MTLPHPAFCEGFIQIISSAAQANAYLAMLSTAAN